MLSAMTEQFFCQTRMALIAPHRRVLPLARRLHARYQQSMLFLPQRLYPLHAQDQRGAFLSYVIVSVAKTFC